MTGIAIANVCVGMKLKLNKMAGFKYIKWGRVEAIGHDWVLVRASNDTVHLLTDDLDYIEEYVEEDEDDWDDQIEYAGSEKNKSRLLHIPSRNLDQIRYDGIASSCTNPSGNPIFIRHRS